MSTPPLSAHTNPANPKVMVGMSGGVDSSLTALVLLEQGYQVEGLFMKNWEEDDGTEYCTAKQDLADAEAVAQKLGIKLHSANFAAEYWDNVFEHFLNEYKAGRTPNPDILCNREIKFKAFLDYAQMLGAEKIATGHYARLADTSTGPTLLKGLDDNKDQSYFLHAVSEQQFAHALFPIGEMEKPRVRELAKQHNLITHNKKDSTGICFIGERRFKDFLEQYIPAQPGDMTTIEGKVIGQHSGLMFYTIGQRQGLGVGGIKGASELPWYVVEKDLKNNRLVVTQGNESNFLFKPGLITEPPLWVDGQGPSLPCSLSAKTRYRQPDQTSSLSSLPNGGLKVTFDQPQRAVTPGQSVVFYEGETCLGGAIIDQSC